MLSVFMLNVIMLNAVMLNAVMLSVVMLKVVAPVQTMENTQALLANDTKRR